MNSLDNPSLEGFAPTRAYRLFGVDYLSLRDADGVSVELTGEGVSAIDDSDRLAALVGRTSAFIAEHDGYSDIAAIKTAEPGSIYMVGSDQPDYHNAFHLSSVHHPAAAPEAIVKAYDFEKFGAEPQFYLGAWLHQLLDTRSDTLSSPRQIALLTAPESGHRTAIMEYMPGSTLSSIAKSLQAYHGFTARNGYAYIRPLRDRVADEISGLLGATRSKLIANDLNEKNVIVVDTSLDSREAEVPATIADRKASIIDQPCVRTGTRLWYPLMSAAARRRRPISGFKPATTPVPAGEAAAVS